MKEKWFVFDDESNVISEGFDTLDELKATREMWSDSYFGFTYDQVLLDGHDEIIEVMDEERPDDL